MYVNICMRVGRVSVRVSESRGLGGQAQPSSTFQIESESESERASRPAAQEFAMAARQWRRLAPSAHHLHAKWCSRCLVVTLQFICSCLCLLCVFSPLLFSPRPCVASGRATRAAPPAMTKLNSTMRILAMNVVVCFIILVAVNCVFFIHGFNNSAEPGRMARWGFGAFLSPAPPHPPPPPPPPLPVPWNSLENLQLESCVEPPPPSTGQLVDVKGRRVRIRKIQLPPPSDIDPARLEQFCSSWLSAPEKALLLWRRTCRSHARCIINTSLHDQFPVEICVLHPVNSSSVADKFLIRFPFVDPANVAHAIEDASVVISMKMLMNLPLEPEHCILEVYETQKRKGGNIPGYRFLEQSVCNEILVVEAKTAQQRAKAHSQEESLSVLQFAHYGFNFMWDGFYPPAGTYQAQGGLPLQVHHGYLDRCQDWSLPSLATEYMFCFMTQESYPCRHTPSTVHITYIDRPPGDPRRIRNSDELFQALDAIAPTTTFNASASASLQSQAKAVGSTKVVVGVHGAGMGNVFWLSQGSLIIEVVPWVKHQGRVRRFEGTCFQRQAIARGCQYEEILAKPPKITDPTQPFNFEATYTNPEVDIDVIVDRVKAYVASQAERSMGESGIYN